MGRRPAAGTAVTQRLQADGYTVYAPPNPLQGLAYDPAYLADFLHTISGPIVLVGHSYGGAVITNAAAGDQQVKALVYVDAFVPAQGQTLAQLLAASPRLVRRAGEPDHVFNLVPFPGAPQRRVRRLHQAERVPRLLRQRPARQRRPGARRHPAAAGNHRVHRAVRCPGLEDHPVLGRGRHRRPRHPAGRCSWPWPSTAHAHITEVDAPHLSMISNPGIVTNVILQAVHATR